MKLEIELLTPAGLPPVFKTPLRRYPSIAIQEDTLSILTSHAQDILDYLSKQADLADSEVTYSAEYLYEVLNGLQKVYMEYGDEK